MVAKAKAVDSAMQRKAARDVNTATAAIQQSDTDRLITCASQPWEHPGVQGAKEEN